MSAFLCRSGLTSRLVEADDATEALERYLTLVPRAQVLAGARGDVHVAEATEAELDAMRRRRPRPAANLELALDLPPARRPNRGEHA